MNKFLFILSLLVLGAMPIQVHAQDYLKPQEYELGPIAVEGADNFDHNALRAIAGLKQGDRVMIPGEKIAQAIKNLWEEGLFSDVEITVDKITGDIAYLRIKVQTRPKLSYFRFSDNVTKKDADKIREEINLYSGRTISENLINVTRFRVRGYYLEKGYYQVQVNIERYKDTLVNNAEYFVISVDKGNKVKIKDITFTGNESIKAGKLRRSMKDTKRRSLLNLFKKSKYSQAAYRRDKENVIRKFNENGLRDATIVSDSVYLLDNKNLMIDIKIEEGQMYYFGEIEWVGNSIFTTGFLDTVLGIKPGDPYNQGLLEQRLFMSPDGRDISSQYMDRGYLFFNLVPVEVSITEGNRINYQMRIVEGKEARVRNIIIRGNTKTNENVIRREIRIRPGDLFNRNDIIRTQRELGQLGYFNPEAFQVNPIPNPQDGTVDIEFIVEERPSDQIELSGGYGFGRVILTLGLSFNNFSIKNIFNKSAWQPLPAGDGQQFSIRGQANGRFFQSYNLSFTEPWLGGKKPTSLSFWANHSRMDQGGLFGGASQAGLSKINITGIGVGLGKRLKWPDDYFTVYHELSYNYYEVFNGGNWFAIDKGYGNMFAYKMALSRNSITDFIYPRGGSKINLSFKTTPMYSLFDGVSDYSSYTQSDLFNFIEMYKIKFTGEYFFPLTKDKKLVLMPRFGFAFMGTYSASKGVSPMERFYMGGSGLTGIGMMDGREIIALRGYDDLAVASQIGDPLATKFTLELRYPISLNPSATFFILGFAEAGNTYTSIRNYNPFNVKRSAGVGVRIFLPMFGMLGLDYGWGFDMLDPHSQGYGTHNQQILSRGYRGQFHFTIGMNLGEL
jgi:outer membrane protein insertion porin family